MAKPRFPEGVNGGNKITLTGRNYSVFYTEKALMATTYNSD